jgi:hypothetical protein
MHCCFCNKHVESIDEAVELGWYPDFWKGDVNYQGPICEDCQKAYLVTDESGEYRLKPDCQVPPRATPMNAIRQLQRVRWLATDRIGPKFPLGRIVATPAALKALEDSGQTPDFFLDRHVQGNWGEVDDGDKRLNGDALVNGDRLLSAYRTLRNVRIWVITEADRSSTCILLPEEY